MPEDLTPGDVEQFTEGRMLQTDPETVRALDAALARVRRWCGWHVTPARRETITRDRPYSNMLIIPTLKIRQVHSITVDGQAMDLSDIRVSNDVPGMLQTVTGRPWAYSCNLGQIEVELTHGFTAAEAQDFREAVLELIDNADISKGTGGDGPLTSKRVDDVEYHWSGFVDRTFGIAKNPMNESLLYQYRILAFA